MNIGTNGIGHPMDHQGDEGCRHQTFQPQFAFDEQVGPGRPLGRQILRSLSSTPPWPLVLSHLCAPCSTDVAGREN